MIDKNLTDRVATRVHFHKHIHLIFYSFAILEVNSICLANRQHAPNCTFRRGDPDYLRLYLAITICS